MAYLKGETCRLCLSSISDKNFKLIEGVSSNNGIIDVLKLNFNDGQKHVMCNICSQKLHAALEFKSACLSTETAITSYMDIEELVFVDIREIFNKQKGVAVLDEQKICRLCMQLIKGEFTSAYEFDMDTFLKYIPEMNFSLTKDPVICKLCLDSLLIHTSFMKNCFDIETMIKKSLEENVVAPEGATYSEVWIKSETIEQDDRDELKPESEPSENNFENINVKWEEDEALMKTENIEIKDECVEEQSLLLTHDPLELYEGVPMARSQIEVKQFSDSKIKFYECDECDYKTKWREALKLHVLNHKDPSEIPWFKCDICNYKSKRKFHLKEHMVTHKDSSEIKWFTCDFCEYKAKRKSHLKRHVLTHKDSLETDWYDCDMCDQKFRLKANLERHKVVHKDLSEIEWYECDKCSYKSKRKINLKEHMLTHKNPSEIKWYMCDSCDYKAKTKSHLNRHLLMHKDPFAINWHQCDICGQKCKLKSHLKIHMLVHKDPSEVKWYHCDLCGYKSKQNSNLKKHILTHKVFS